MPEPGFEHDVAAAQLVLCQRQDVENRLIDVQPFLARRLALHECANTPDDFGRPLAITGNALERPSGLVHLGRLGREPACARGSTGDNRPEGLIHFMRDGSGELPHCHHTCHVRKLVLRVTQGFLSFPPIVYIG